MDSFWWASMDLVFWGLTSSYLKQNNPGIPNIVPLFLGGIIFWVFVQNSQRDINMPLLNDAWNRNLINLFTTPVRLREFVLGTLILGIIKLSFTALALTLLAFFLYQFNIFSFGWYLLPAVISLILTGWWIGFIINGLILRYGFRVESFAWALIFVIYPFSAIFYPVSMLPAWARTISLFLPTSYIFENMRNILFGQNLSYSDILTSYFLNFIYLGFSLIFLKVMFNGALKHARLVKLN